MKNVLVFAVVLVALSCSVSFGATVRYRGNPRLIPDQGLCPGNAPGPGPFAFPGPPVFLDSSRNQFGIYVSRFSRMSSNGTGVVGIGIRGFLSGRSCECWISTDDGVTWFVDSFLGNYRYPHLDFTAPDRYGFVTATAAESTFDAAWYIRNSGGYGSGIWDAPVQITPGGIDYQNAQGAWLGSARPWTIGVTMENTSVSGIPLEYKVIDTLGNEVQAITTIFDQNAGTYDYRNGKYACFGGGPSDGLNLKTSTDGGATWVGDSITIYAMNADSGFYEWQNVICQDGTPGVLLTMDNALHTFAGQHSAIQFFKKGHPKVTVFSPSMTEAAAFPQISRKDDNTLVALFEYCPAFDSVAWATGRTFWDIGESHSTDGGLSWSPVGNLTSTHTVSECCPQIARFIGANNRMHITYGTSWRSSQPSDTADLYWAAEYAGGAPVKTYNYYLNGIGDAVDQEVSAGVQRISTYELGPVSPNPMCGFGTVAYRLPNTGHTTFAVYNALGQRVRTLVDRFLPAGQFTALWDGRNEARERVPAGIYFFRLSSGSFTRVREAVVVH